MPAELPLKMEAKELRTVYNYCRSLPLLMEQGIVGKNEKTKELCQNIMSLLRPMFGKEHKLREHRSTARRLFNRA